MRDFGSKNGTYVNGNKIGQREPHQTPEEGAKITFSEYDLQQGDELKLSSTVFNISVEPDSSLIKTPIVERPEPQGINWLEFLKNLLIRANKGEKN